MADRPNKPNLWAPAPRHAFGRDPDSDRFGQQRKEASWIKHHGERFQPFPGVFCMSWRWPKWWGPPTIFDKETAKFAPLPIMPPDASKWAGIIHDHHTFTKNGLPARLLRFWSGTQVWQLVNPVHGFDKPGATLPEPGQTHLFPS